MVMTTLFVVLAIAQATQPSALLLGAAAVAAVGILAVRYAALVVGSREMTVGSRAHAHREALSTIPAPAHPTTAGRPRTRAPSQSITAA